MGGIVHTLFGGSDSKQSSVSGNNAYGMLSNALGGNITTGNSAFARMAAALGLGGDTAGANAGLDAYKNSSGYNFLLDSGSKAITDNAAAKGLLTSGATGKSLTKFGQDLGSTTFNNYLQQLGTLFNGGMQSAATIAGAGQFSNQSSKSSSTGGIIPALFG